MININYQGRLGNNLLQYFFASILSEKTSQQIITKPPVNNFFNILQNNIQNFSFTIDVNDNNFLEIYHTENIKQNLLINDYFQKCNLIKKFIHKINTIINKNILSINYNNGIFLHYRIGDLLIGPSNRIGKIDFFREATKSIDNFQNLPKFISSDSPNHEYIQRLINEFGYQLYSGSPIDTIIFASSFSNKIISLGSFSWWIAVLNNQNNIIYHDPKVYHKWYGDIYCFDHWKKIC